MILRSASSAVSERRWFLLQQNEISALDGAGKYSILRKKCISSAIFAYCFKGIINFIKNIPEFDFFKTDNQVRIIRSCTVEVFLVNLALFYDETRDVITIGNSSYPLSSMAEVGVTENGLREFRTTLLALDKMQLTERESSLVGFLII